MGASRNLLGFLPRTWQGKAEPSSQEPLGQSVAIGEPEVLGRVPLREVAPHLTLAWGRGILGEVGGADTK